eukprot:7908367-Pyramimonas_sp.AAC.1
MKALLKFNGKPVPTLKNKRHFDVGQPRGQNQGNIEARPFEPRKACDRLQDSTYQKKSYLDQAALRRHHGGGEHECEGARKAARRT